MPCPSLRCSSNLLRNEVDGIDINGRYDAPLAYLQDVNDDDHADNEWQQHDVPHEHLAEVCDVEHGADADRVEPVLRLGTDPLRVEVGLHQVAGERRTDRAEEADGPGDPCHRSTAAPCSHPELSPQVDDHEREEEPNAPQWQAVEQVARGGR